MPASQRGCREGCYEIIHVGRICPCKRVFRCKEGVLGTSGTSLPHLLPPPPQVSWAEGLALPAAAHVNADPASVLRALGKTQAALGEPWKRKL